MQSTMHVYEVHPRRDRRGVDLISHVLPFGRLWFSTTPHNQEPQGGMGPRCGSLSLSLCPSLNAAECVGPEATSAFAALSESSSLQSVSVSSASATRDVVQRHQVPNFDG